MKFVVNICTCPNIKHRIMADWAEVSRYRWKQYNTVSQRDLTLTIFSGAVLLCNFPDARGSVSRRPIGYCSVCVPFVIWVMLWLHTDFDAVLPLCGQQQNHRPQSTWWVDTVGWYRDREVCWFIISIIAPSVVPEEKFKIIYRARTIVCECVHTVCEYNAEVWGCVLQPRFVYNVKTLCYL